MCLKTRLSTSLGNLRLTRERTYGIRCKVVVEFWVNTRVLWGSGTRCVEMQVPIDDSHACKQRGLE